MDAFDIQKRENATFDLYDLRCLKPYMDQTEQKSNFLSFEYQKHHQNVHIRSCFSPIVEYPLMTFLY